MQLDDFLNSRSIVNLQTLQWLWAPATRRSASKFELLRILRQSMLSPANVRTQFNSLDTVQQDLLRALLRLDGYEGDAALRLRRLSQPPATPQAERQVVEDLARRGFLAPVAPRVASPPDALWAAIPQELGDVLAEALNLDIREPASMLSLTRFLAVSGHKQRQPIAALAEPQAIEGRIAVLSDPVLQSAVRFALEEHAGILPLERFPSVGLDIEAVDGPAWRAALEAALLGTFGHLSLLDLGLGDDHDCLVLFQELVAAHAAACTVEKPQLDHVYATGIDFLTDLMAVVDFIRAEAPKLTAAGRFLKGTRNQVLPLCALRTSFFMDEDSLLAFKLTVAQALGLAEARDDGRLHATPAAADWERQPLVHQARELLDALIALGARACPPHHFHAIARAARTVLSDSPPGLWLPTNAFLARALSRYLLYLLDARGDTQPACPASPDGPPWQSPRSLSTIGAIAAAVREPLLQALNCAGVLDIGRRGGQALVAPSSLAPAILGDAPLPAPRGPLILVNPDAEVILFPEDGHIVLLHRLAAFCERAKSQVTLHLRITQDSIERAVLRGLGSDEMLATLRDNCRAPLPQNIEYCIRNWAASIHRAQILTLHVLELPSAEALDAAIRLPELAPLVVRRLSPTAVALTSAQLSAEAEAALRRLGIHLT